MLVVFYSQHACTSLASRKFILGCLMTYTTNAFKLAKIDPNHAQGSFEVINRGEHN